MHHSYQILPEQQLIIEKISGEFTVEDLFFSSKCILADPLFDTIYDGIVDMRQATANLSKVELLGFTDLIEQTGAFRIKSKWAFITTDPIVRTLTDTYKNRLDHAEHIQACSTIQEAANFVNKPQAINYLDE